MNRFAAWSIAVSSCLCAATSSADSPQEPATPARVGPTALAVLVGINEYPADCGFGALAGPENDVARAREVLTSRLDFGADGIVTLIGKDATHEKIVRAIKTHLIDRATAQTHVVLWLSGHGSRVPDLSNHDSAPRDTDESATDTTFVAYDSRSSSLNGAYDITDDELFSLLSAVPSKDVVFIADCCHSSGLLRGGPRPGVREAPIGTSPLDRKLIDPFWPAGVEWREDDPRHELPSNVVFVSACSATYEAGEIEISGKTYGTMTWFLANTLLEADKNDSWSLVVMKTRALVAGTGSRFQLVSAHGAADRAIFGPAGTSVPSSFYRVDWIDSRQSTRLRVDAGRLQGIGEGAELDVFDLSGKRVGGAAVDKVAPTYCNATWSGAEKPPLAALRAYPKTLGDSTIRLRIHLANGVDKTLVAAAPEVRVVDRAEAEYELHAAGKELELRDRNGRWVRRMSASADDVRLALLKEQQFRSLWQGVAVPGRYKIEVTVAPATREDLDRLERKRPAAAVHDARTEPGSTSATIVTTRFAGDHDGGGCVKLSIKNCEAEPLHIAVISASEDREVNVLFGQTSENVIGAGMRHEKIVWVGVGERWTADLPMTDRYIVVATERHADFMPFESRSGSATRGTAVAELPPFLRQALGSGRTRGDADLPRWGIATCNLQIVTPELFAKSRSK